MTQPETPCEHRTLCEQSRALETGAITAVALAERALQSASDQQALNAFVSLDEDTVLEQAEAADTRRRNGRPSGPLDGLPIAIKDNYLTRDYPTTACSNARPLMNADVDATIVANLRSAGAVIFGKTNMHEWAYGATNTTSCYGATRNPHNQDHITGGSSGGSGAAVAARIVHGAIGSDTGGSVRIPSAACGIYGFKPTYGRASRSGILPLSWSLDAPGPMAASLSDIELMLPCFLGRDTSDAATLHAQGYRHSPTPTPYRLLSLIGEGLERADEVDLALSEALYRASISRQDIVLDQVTSYFAAWEAILHSEATAYHAPLLATQGEAFSPVTRAHLEAGQRLNAGEVLKAQSIRASFTRRLLRDLGDWDALVLPTLPVTAPRQGDDWQEFGGTRATTQDSMTWFCWPGNLAGLPCLSLPVSTSANGLPIGMMLMGRPGQDERLLGIARDLEARGLKGR